jgi:hypothetical protein
LPKIVTWSYGGSPTLRIILARLESKDYPRTQISEFNSLRVLESVLKLKRELGPRNEVSQVPSEQAVEARLVLGRGPAARAVRPSASAVGGHVGDRVWVVDGEDHGDVAGLDAVDLEVGELEGVAGELLVGDVELSGEDIGEEERNACDEDVGEVHGDGVMLFVG